MTTPKFEGFARSAPQGKPVTRAILRKESADVPSPADDGNGSAPAEPTATATATVEAPQVSAWSGNEIYDLHKLAIAIRQSTEEVLTRTVSAFDDMMKGHLAKQDELGRQHQKLVERLIDYNRKESPFLIAIIGTLVLFAVIYLIK